ncbi:MAG: C4-type zinc ribbon domain-containing protein [Humidesulfovibrio sp.]|jgi:predicted  nucleic acid-binding Zn-ribbon protein|uniref:zinc ribbon domain-containing protein n=1 Tax=Humidesulfovibrio sp. TaxID=2910988 RepID=UPI002732CE9F|nr:C4-type zinc ribbon domain-containing protein [Humidesulfovibrio sp.]MDP2849199.1 C4-type zinc ribbon domain-containing protein [Humidesulfovibrio sp.]
MYQKQIEQLVVLQTVDDEIKILEGEVREAPLELTGLEAKVAVLRERQAQVQERLDILKGQQKRLEGEIEDDGHKIKKSKNKLMAVGNSKEYHAMMREMDSMEKLNRLREEERIAVMEELERQDSAMAEVVTEIEGFMEGYDAKKATLDERIGKAQGRLDALIKRRTKAGKVVPPPILGRYEFIRSRIEHPVIVPVSEGICGGCHIKIPPQAFNELQKGKQILGCPNCQRIVYWVEHSPHILD